MNVTDNKNIGIIMSVWAIHDDYDYINIPNYISVTKLIKPLKQIVMGHRAPPSKEVPDIESFIARALGSSIHASVEKAWDHYETNLKKLGYPQDVIDMVRINPKPEELFEGCIAIYIEQRSKKSIGGHVIGGKFDIIAEGILHDNKTTTTFTWVNGGRDYEHMLQGSIYKWLNPDKVTSDYIRINYLFTDWQAFMARQKPTYPQSRIQQKDIILMTVPETENWVKRRLADIDKYWDAPENLIPECTPEELWQSDPVFKYYADPTKTEGKSTKNFDDRGEAYLHLAQKGVGIIKEIPGEPKRCGYCDSYDICNQRKRYFPDPV